MYVDLLKIYIVEGYEWKLRTNKTRTILYVQHVTCGMGQGRKTQ